MYPTLRRNGIWNSPLGMLRDELDRVFDGNWNDTTETGAVSYPVDIHEDENHLYVEAEMPGFRKEEIDITLERGTLTISAERKVEETKKGKSHLTERRYNRIARRFSLPNTVSDSDVEAKLEDGVLHLTLNKREESKPKRIEVK